MPTWKITVEMILTIWSFCIIFTIRSLFILVYLIYGKSLGLYCFTSTVSSTTSRNPVSTLYPCDIAWKTSCCWIYLSVSRPTSSPTPSPVAIFNTTESTALPSLTVEPTSTGLTAVMSSSAVPPVTIPRHIQR